MSGPVYEAVREYLHRGYAVVPIPHGKKQPIIEGWQKLRLTEAKLPRHFNGQPQNVGLLLGKPSGHLVDVDLDCQEARALAHWLPNTDMVSGRPGSPSSHRFYRAEGIKTKKYTDLPIGSAPDGDDSRRMLIELRSTGTQTLVPPSVHPSGEPIRWERYGDPASVDAAELVCTIGRIAAASLIARHWPAEGSLHDAALALAGALLLNGLDEGDATEFITGVAHAAHDKEVRDRVTTVATTARRIADGERVTGLPTLADLLD